MQDPALDPIRNKVELYRESRDSVVPFEIAANDTFPTDAERPVIAKWANLRDQCLQMNERFLQDHLFPEGSAWN